MRQKIIEELSSTREIRVMKLAQRVNSTYNDLNRNLVTLEKEGIIINEYREVVRHGRIRILRLNMDNEKTKVLLIVLKAIKPNGSS